VLPVGVPEADVGKLRAVLPGVPMVVCRSEDQAEAGGGRLTDAELAGFGVGLVLHPLAAVLAALRGASLAYRAIAQFRFRQKLELLRRGLEDDSPAVRGSALIALEGLSRAHPGDVNAYRPMLHELAARDPNVAVRRLAIVCFKNGTPARETILILDGIADDDEADADVRKTARSVSLLLVKKSNQK